MKSIDYPGGGKLWRKLGSHFGVGVTNEIRCLIRGVAGIISKWGKYLGGKRRILFAPSPELLPPREIHEILGSSGIPILTPL